MILKKPLGLANANISKSCASSNAIRQYWCQKWEDLDKKKVGKKDLIFTHFEKP